MESKTNKNSVRICRGKAVLLQVAVQTKMHQAGHSFYLSENGGMADRIGAA